MRYLYSSGDLLKLGKKMSFPLRTSKLKEEVVTAAPWTFGARDQQASGISLAYVGERIGLGFGNPSRV